MGFRKKCSRAITSGASSRHSGNIVEELPGGDLTVFVPLAPTPGVGMLQIVSGTKVQKLECRMTDALGWNLNWGMGTDALFKTPNAPQ
jgi:uncharacterized membrane protein